MTTASAIQVLAGWTVALTPADPPDTVKQVAIRCLMDTLGVMLAGSATPAAGYARRVAEQNAAAGPAAVAGGDRRLGAPAAAFANAAAAHALDFDDNCYAGFVHGSAVIVPAALAVAQARRADGEALLTALIAGAECQYRVGMALGRTLYDRGWWTTGVLGVIGACAAAARLLKLDAETTAHALGLAVAGAGGAKSVFGSDAKPLLAGRAAEAGVMAAQLAEQGAIGPMDALEHAYGLAALFNGGRFEPDWLDPSADRWCLLDPGVDVKRIPVCLSSHAAVDGALKLAAEQGFRPRDIAEIHCDVPPIVAANLIYPRPQTGRQSQFSLQFAVAASLLYGELTLDHLDDGLMADGELRDLMARIHMVSGPSWADPALLSDAPEGAAVSIRLQNGETHRCFVARAAGSARAPLSDQALERKFLRCAGRVMTPANAGRMASALWRLAVLPRDGVAALPGAPAGVPADSGAGRVSPGGAPVSGEAGNGI